MFDQIAGYCLVHKEMAIKVNIKYLVPLLWGHINARMIGAIARTAHKTRDISSPLESFCDYSGRSDVGGNH